MILTFDIKEYSNIYNVLVNVLGFNQDCFLTDDCIQIDKADFNAIKNALPKTEFKTI